MEAVVLYRHRRAIYEIVVANPRGVARGVAQTDVDGLPLVHPTQGVALQDDARTHRVEVVHG